MDKTFNKENILGWLLVGWTVIPGVIAVSMAIKQKSAVKNLQEDICNIAKILAENELLEIRNK